MSSSLDPADLRSFAADLARIGGRAADRLFGKVSVARKPDNSPVTEADHITQDAILRALSERYPTHAVIVEETLADPMRHAELAGCDYCWVIDPIDGTRNYGRGVRVYATSVAVLLHGRPVAGAVYDATSDVVFSAGQGFGAFREGEPLAIAEAEISRETTIAVGSFRRRPMPEAVKGWMSHYLMRNQGSTALHLAWVAAGLVDAAYSNECKIWDIAAAAVIIEEAGGVISSEAGEGLWPRDLEDENGQDMQILAAVPKLHAILLESLNRPS